jgi:hypothetical protein
VRVYSAHMVRSETVEVSDPYARALAADGDRVCLVPPDLQHEAMVGGVLGIRLTAPPCCACGMCGLRAAPSALQSSVLRQGQTGSRSQLG